MDSPLRRSLFALVALVACNGGENTTEFMTPSTTGTGSSSSDSGGEVTTPTSTTRGDTSTGTPTETSPTATTPPDHTSSGSESTSTGPEPTSGSTSSGEATASSSEGGSSSTGEPAPSCDDDALNQDETDVDCGGALCDGCAPGGACEVDADCADGWCDAGVCGDPGCLVDADCDPLDQPCANFWCNLETKSCEGEPTNEGDLCDDGDACTSFEQCTLGVCADGVAVDCSGLDNACGLGLCDPDDGGCKASPLPDMEGKPCDDGFVCTPDDACAAGLCGVGGPGFLWFEDFTDPDPGIELGPQWAIGAAVASPAGKNGADPDDDHSPSDDKMLAGTLIGALFPNGAFAKTCLTTPPIDTNGQPSLWLTFWRHLHVDNLPFMTNTIEVWNGKEWKELESGYPNPGVGDVGWTLKSYDMTDHVNSALQVRICVAQTAAAKAVGGWSVDDITIGPFVCTPN